MKVHAPELFEPRRNPNWPPKHHAKYLRENVGIDPAILAADMGVAICYVYTVQRYLKLRRLTTWSDYRKDKA